MVRAHDSMTPVHKVYGSSPTRGFDRMLSRCSPRSEWVPGGNTRKIKVAKK